MNDDVCVDPIVNAVKPNLVALAFVSGGSLFGETACLYYHSALHHASLLNITFKRVTACKTFIKIMKSFAKTTIVASRHPLRWECSLHFNDTTAILYIDITVGNTYLKDAVFDFDHLRISSNQISSNLYPLKRLISKRYSVIKQQQSSTAIGRHLMRARFMLKMGWLMDSTFLNPLKSWILSFNYLVYDAEDPCNCHCSICGSSLTMNSIVVKLSSGVKMHYACYIGMFGVA